MTPVGAREEATTVGVDIQQSRYNYYKGSDPTQWAANVPVYGKVVYSDIYDGVDLVYYGIQQKLEYDFVVSPGVNPSVIKLSFDGAHSVKINNSNDLILSLEGGELILKAPVAYQEKNGKRIKVDSRYVKVDTNLVTFMIDSYDESTPLVIDPVLSYSTLIGGSNDDIGNGIAVDESGNMYVTGYTFDGMPDYPVTDDSMHSGGSDPYDCQDIFITKLSANGTMVFSTLIGGSDIERGESITIDDIGYMYVTGWTASTTDYPVTNGSTHTGGTDVFVTKLSPTGKMDFSTLIGGLKDDRAYDIAIDSSRNMYVSGYTDYANTNYPVTDSSKHKGESDVFVTKLSSTGIIIFSTLIGGSFSDVGKSIAVDKSRHAYVTGYTFDAWNSLADYPVTDGSTHNGITDVFVTKLTLGGGIAFSTLIGGSNSDHSNSIAIDNSGNTYVAGHTNSIGYPVTNLSSLKGGHDVFVTRISPAGVITFSTFIGGSEADYGKGIALDGSKNIYVTGFTRSTDYPVTDGSRYTGGVSEVFVTRIDPLFGGLTFSTLIGGSLNESGSDIAVDDSGNVYVTGRTQDSAIDFPVTDGSSPNGAYDVFVTKITPPGPAVRPKSVLTGPQLLLLNKKGVD